ncbi:MAG: EamA family transporter [Proteobacteria bacterium]|jgi:drug/metabolite transporter (DMT)-like permease|nr:EamA family transporter [Pseudomonadota bacterium]
MSAHAKSILSGLFAIALWSWSFALSRSLAERLGVVTAAAGAFLVAGAIGSIFGVATGWHRPALANLPKRRIALLGGLFAAYQVAVYAALGTAHDREGFLAVTVINYLWPGLTILLAIPILGRKLRAPLIPGLAIAFLGVLLGTFGGRDVSAAALRAGLAQNSLPYGLALFAAACWALYSNLVARWAKGAGSGLVPFYFLAAGAALCPFALLEPAPAAWSAGAIAELAALAIGVMLVGYVAWDFSMRHRESELVPALSYLIPLPSIAVSGAYLGIEVGWTLFAAAALVIAGSVICWRSVAGTRERTP